MIDFFSNTMDEMKLKYKTITTLKMNISKRTKRHTFIRLQVKPFFRILR